MTDPIEIENDKDNTDSLFSVNRDGHFYRLNRYAKQRVVTRYVGHWNSITGEFQINPWETHSIADWVKNPKAVQSLKNTVAQYDKWWPLSLLGSVFTQPETARKMLFVHHYQTTLREATTKLPEEKFKGYEPSRLSVSSSLRDIVKGIGKLGEKLPVSFSYSGGLLSWLYDKWQQYFGTHAWTTKSYKKVAKQFSKLPESFVSDEHRQKVRKDYLECADMLLDVEDFSLKNYSPKLEEDFVIIRGKSLEDACKYRWSTEALSKKLNRYILTPDGLYYIDERFRTTYADNSDYIDLKKTLNLSSEQLQTLNNEWSAEKIHYGKLLTLEEMNKLMTITGHSPVKYQFEQIGRWLFRRYKEANAQYEQEQLAKQKNTQKNLVEIKEQQEEKISSLKEENINQPPMQNVAIDKGGIVVETQNSKPTQMIPSQQETKKTSSWNVLSLLSNWVNSEEEIPSSLKQLFDRELEAIKLVYYQTDVTAEKRAEKIKEIEERLNKEWQLYQQEYTNMHFFEIAIDSGNPEERLKQWYLRHWQTPCKTYTQQYSHLKSWSDVKEEASIQLKNFMELTERDFLEKDTFEQRLEEENRAYQTLQDLLVVRDFLPVGQKIVEGKLQHIKKLHNAFTERLVKFFVTTDTSTEQKQSIPPIQEALPEQSPKIKPTTKKDTRPNDVNPSVKSAPVIQETVSKQALHTESHEEDLLQTWKNKKEKLQQALDRTLSALQNIENNSKRQTQANDEIKIIRKAYHQLSLKFHPDTIAIEDEAKKMVATTIFNELKDLTDNSIKQIETTQYIPKQSLNGYSFGAENNEISQLIAEVKVDLENLVKKTCEVGKNIEDFEQKLNQRIENVENLKQNLNQRIERIEIFEKEFKQELKELNLNSKQTEKKIKENGQLLQFIMQAVNVTEEELLRDETNATNTTSQKELETKLTRSNSGDSTGTLGSSDTEDKTETTQNDSTMKKSSSFSSVNNKGLDSINIEQLKGSQRYQPGLFRSMSFDDINGRIIKFEEAGSDLSVMSSKK